MTFTRLMPAIACVALLAACASPSERAGNVAAGATMASLIAAADAAVAAGKPDKAYAILKHAGQVVPTDKTPWVRIAQMRFNADNYGDAIVNALEALERDPDDMLAYSIVVVGGLRVSSKALGQLMRKNKINGDVKAEAQELAQLLRSSLGEAVLVPTTKLNPPASSRVPTTAVNSPKSSLTSIHQFGTLK